MDEQPKTIVSPVISLMLNVKNVKNKYTYFIYFSREFHLSNPYTE